jgi:hypothetical protein
MFVLVTIFACWLGWNLYQLRERDRFAQEIELHGGNVVPSMPGFEASGRLPWSWRLLGARPFVFVLVGAGDRRDDWDRIERFFPEATVARNIEGSRALSMPPAEDWERLYNRQTRRVADQSGMQPPENAPAN